MKNKKKEEKNSNNVIFGVFFCSLFSSFFLSLPIEQNKAKQQHHGTVS